MTLTLIEFLAVGLFALLAAYLLQKFLTGFDQKIPESLVILPNAHGDLTYLFEEDQLLQATEPAQRLLDSLQPDANDWQRVSAFLADRFPSLSEDAAKLKDDQRVRISASGDPSLHIDIERAGPRVRLTLDGSDQPDLIAAYKNIERAALEREHDMLRSLTQNAPQLIWKEDANGRVTWGNRAFMTYSDKMLPGPESGRSAWPAHRLFESLAILPPDATDIVQSRQSLCLHGEQAEHWFDVTSIPMADGTTHYAADANATVRAEQSQRAFMQTIGQTFAQLSVGLAIFDKQRQLTTFNPALLELTELPFAFLSSRPSLDGVLDRLRDARKLPEPKNYSSWKEQFVAMEAAAKTGSYIETWSLPDGQMLRVTGRPHPDGAIAFLFEDISAEVSLTRRFRTEIETGQAVLDTMPDAIAVFSASQTLVLMNDAYSQMWGEDATNMSGNLDLRAALRTWKVSCAPSSVWRTIETFAGTRGERSEWSEEVIMNDGRRIECRTQPITGGMTMVQFSSTARISPTIQKLRQVDIPLSAAKR